MSLYVCPGGTEIAGEMGEITVEWPPKSCKAFQDSIYFIAQCCMPLFKYRTVVDSKQLATPAKILAG